MLLKSSEHRNLAIPLPITQENFQIAQQFAIQQPTEKKAEQVFLNTLAVLVVNNYLTMLGISTDLTNSDSWNRVMQISCNVADLNISGIGKLECRPIKSSVSHCLIPPEVRDSSIGYVVVEIDNSYKKATILGFTPQVKTQELAITSLKPPEALIDCIHQLKESNVTDLNLWLSYIFEAEWQTAESLLNLNQLTPNFGFRSPEISLSNVLESSLENERVSRARLINLGIQFSDRQVVLLVEINSEDDNNLAVTLQVHPIAPDTYLPKELKLKVIETSDIVFMEAQARSKDNYIQLQFSGQPQEVFKVEIILNKISFSEKFKL